MRVESHTVTGVGCGLEDAEHQTDGMTRRVRLMDLHHILYLFPNDTHQNVFAPLEACTTYQI